MNKVTFEWNTVDNIPDKDKPIICITGLGKLCLFRFESNKYRERCHWIIYSNFEKVVKHYHIKYWAYQDNLIID